MGEYVRDRDFVLPAAAKVGHELAERRVEREDAFTHERQRERGRRELRKRGEIE